MFHNPTNHDLSILSKWAKQWLVNFIPNKTEAMLFTLKMSDHMPLLQFDKHNYNIC